MLEIHEIKDFTNYTALLEGISSDAPHVIEAIENDICVGNAVYDYLDDCVRLLSLRCIEDLYLLDGIVRTVMLKGSLAGLEYAELTADTAENADAFKKLGFLKEGSGRVKIDDFLGKCKHCENSEKEA